MSKNNIELNSDYTVETVSYNNSHATFKVVNTLEVQEPDGFIGDLKNNMNFLKGLIKAKSKKV